MLLFCLVICFSFCSTNGFVADGASPSASTGSGNCTDKPGVNCAVIDSYLHVCADMDKAKDLCKSFCKLCDLVDGNWSGWSAWSSCDVSCGGGNKTRVRTCDNPAPSHGGSDCSGDSKDFAGCSVDHCVVDGDWSTWGAWGTCSVSCGVGIQRRDRSCTNPAPQFSGNHCFGDSHEDKVCLPGHCTDGGWSTWASWGPCSHSCGSGIRTRERSCTNPTPSTLGDYCKGPASQSDICGTDPDPAYTLDYYDHVCCTVFNEGRHSLCGGGGVPSICSTHKGWVQFGSNSACNNGWDDKDADVYCRTLGYCSGRAMQMSISQYAFNHTIERYDNFTCTGSESIMSQCGAHHDHSGVACTADKLAAVICQ